MPDYNYYPVSDKTGRDILNTLGEMSNAVRAIAEGSGKLKRYGFRVKADEANPSDRVEYIYDAIGMTPAGLDGSDVYNYGTWRDVWFVRGNYPCMVKSTGEVDYKLNPLNHALREDGSASDVANTAYAGNAMSAIPLVWCKRYTEGGYRYFVCCESKYDETYKAYAHTRPDGSISPYAFGPMYKGSMSAGTLRSLSGQRPQSGTTAAQELAAAKANGSRWGLRTWAFDELVSDLLTLMNKSTNLQSKNGQGHTTGGSSAESFLDTGTLDTAGQFAGKSVDTTSQVKVFYMEGFWGERWDREEGMIYKDGVYFAKPTPEGDGYNFAGTGYAEVGALSPASDGYVKHFTSNEFGSFPAEVGGSASTFECDYFYQNQQGVRVPLRGGFCYVGANCGRFVYVNYVADAASWGRGASPFLDDPS